TSCCSHAGASIKSALTALPDNLQETFSNAAPAFHVLIILSANEVCS
ncbi:2305_t:CDS:1, partial [Diversispora eburnea]